MLPTEEMMLVATPGRSNCTYPTRRSPTCASAWRARAFPTRRRASRGPTARRSPTCASWSTTGAIGFDWRAQEARLNAFPQFTVPLHGIDAALPARAGPGPDAVPAAAVARLAGLGVRVPRADPAPHRPGALRRRCGRCVHRGGAVAARLRPVVRARPAALRRRGDRRLLRRADDRRAGLSRASPRRAATGARSSPRGSATRTPTS